MKSRTWYRHERARKAAQSGSGGLPMPHAGHTGRITTEERAEYRARQERHHLQFPDYAAGWARPSPETAKRVYDFVQDFVPLDSIHPDPVTAMQLITVALDVAVVSARYGHRAEERNVSPEELLHHVKRPLTRNLLTDAILRRWSDHARLAREQERAYSVTQLTQETIEQGWRDLLVQGIHLPALWSMIIGPKNPLFRAQPPPPWKRGEIGAGYEIVLREGRDLQRFESLVQSDPAYNYSRVRHTWRLWIEGEDPPLVDIHPPICAERVFNVVKWGAESERVRQLQEAVRLVFLVGVFMGDYERAVASLKTLTDEIKTRFPAPTPWESRTDEEKKLRVARIKLEAFVAECYSVYEQVRDRKGQTLKIRSGFYKVVNRRWQPAHFWPMAATAKARGMAQDEQEYLRGAEAGIANLRARYPADDPRRIAIEREHARDLALAGVPRHRWFFATAPQPRVGSVSGQWLVSMDISASQTQIQAILLGLDDMERDATSRPHKLGLAQRAWDAHKAELLEGRTDEIERARALEAEKRMYWKQAQRDHPDVGGNTELMKTLNVEHDQKVLEIKQRWAAGPQKYGPLLIGYANETDKRLIDMMKNLWMILGYGSSVLDILREQQKDTSTYGQGWRMKPTLEVLLKGRPSKGKPEKVPDVKAIHALLSTVPGYDERHEFLEACKGLAREMLKANPYIGVTMIDPFDGESFTWNRPAMDAVALRLDDWDITLVKPGEYKKERCPTCRGKATLRGARLRCNDWKTCKTVWPAEFIERPPDEHGNPYLDQEKLRKMIAPCVIHVCDSLFSSLVMTALAEDGVTTFAGIHDAWYVPETIYRDDGRPPEPGHVALQRAIDAAGKPWLLALGPIYDWLRANMGGPQIETAYAKWQARKARGDWPKFLAVKNPPERADNLLLPTAR